VFAEQAATNRLPARLNGQLLARRNSPTSGSPRCARNQSKMTAPISENRVEFRRPGKLHTLENWRCFCDGVFLYLSNDELEPPWA
jgi:hypothetical protein